MKDFQTELEGYVAMCRRCGPLGGITLNGRAAESDATLHIHKNWTDVHQPFVLVVKLEVLRENVVDEKETKEMRKAGKCHDERTLRP